MLNRDVPISGVYSNAENALKPALSVEQQEFLSAIWLKVALGSTVKFDKALDFGSEMPDQVRQELYQTIMRGMDVIIKEWGINIGLDEYLEKIRLAKTIADRSLSEVNLCKEVGNRICQIRKKAQDKVGCEQAEANDKWASWPRAMQEMKVNNCVGAVLIGAWIFDEFGLRHYYCSPAGHAVNILETSDGQAWYVDLNNNQIVNVGLAKDLRINEINYADQELLDYQLLPIYDKEYVVASVLSNIRTLSRKKDKPSDNELIKKEEDRLIELYELESSDNLSRIIRKIYRQKDDNDSSEKMEAERIRIDAIHEGFVGWEREVKKLFAGMSPEFMKVEWLKIKKYREEIKEFLESPLKSVGSLNFLDKINLPQFKTAFLALYEDINSAEKNRQIKLEYFLKKFDRS